MREIKTSPLPFQEEETMKKAITEDIVNYLKNIDNGIRVKNPIYSDADKLKIKEDDKDGSE